MSPAGTEVVSPTTAPTTVEKLQKESSALVEQAKTIKVTSEDTYNIGGQFMRGLKTFERGVAAEFKPIEDAHKAAKAATKGLKDKVMAPILESIALVDPQMEAFQVKKRKIREEQERKAREAAEAKAKKERDEELKRLEAEQERERKAHEKKMAALKKKRDAESKARAEELAAAEKKREEERLAEKKEVEEAPIVTEAVVEKRPIKKTDGVAMKQHWKFTITDKSALLKACAAGECSLDFIKVDQVEIGKVVRSSKGKVVIPGISPYVVEGRDYKGVD